MARKLLHLPNRPELLNSHQQSAYLSGGFQGAKLMPEHTADHVAQLEALRPGGYYVARLQNSTRPDGSFPSFGELSSLWYAKVAELEPVGVYIYQLDTEPNNQVKEDQAFTWQWLIGQAIGALRDLLEAHWRLEGYSPTVIRYKQSRVQLWLGPLADGPGHWAENERSWWPAQKLLIQQPGLVQGLCVDSYWQYAKHSLLDGFGANCAKYHTLLSQAGRPDLPIGVAEWGCSLIDKWEPEQRRDPTPAMLQEIEAEMMASFPGWLRWVQNNAPYVAWDALFICPESAGWRGFEPSQRVLEAIRAY